MRCPKCSFTSFDHLVTCEKCGRDLTEIVGQLHGTSLKVESPLFLGPALDGQAAEEIFDVSTTTEDVGLGLDQEVDFTQAAETAAIEPFAAEEIALEREPDQAQEEPPPAAGLPDEVELKLQMEGTAEEAAEEIKPERESVESDEIQLSTADSSAPAADAEEEQAGKTGLNFEGLDLSDLSPADDQEMEDAESGDDEESPLDLWSLDTSGDDDLADLFDDLIPAGKTKKQAKAADEQPATEGEEGDDPAEPVAAGDDQPEKDDG